MTLTKLSYNIFEVIRASMSMKLDANWACGRVVCSGCPRI